MSEILKDTISFFFRNILSITYIILPIALLNIIIFNLLPYILYAKIPQFAQYSFLISIKDFFFSPIYTGALIFLFSNILAGEQWTLKESLKTSLRFYPYLFLVGFIYKVSVSIGLLICIIPGLLFAARFSIAGFLVVLEGHKPILSLKQSWELTQKYTWLIAGSISVFCFPLILASFFSHPLEKLLREGILFSALIYFVIILYKSSFTVLFFRFFCLISSKKNADSAAPKEALESIKLDTFDGSPSWLPHTIIQIRNEIKRQKFAIFLAKFPSRKQVMVCIFILWWLSAWTSGEFLMLPIISHLK